MDIRTPGQNSPTHRRPVMRSTLCVHSQRPPVFVSQAPSARALAPPPCLHSYDGSQRGMKMSNSSSCSRHGVVRMPTRGQSRAGTWPCAAGPGTAPGNTSASMHPATGSSNNNNRDASYSNSSSSMASLRAQLEQETYISLRHKAKRANIRGRSAMRKPDLITALLSLGAQDTISSPVDNAVGLAEGCGASKVVPVVSRAQLEKMTLTSLYDMAKQLKMPRRSYMKKAGLVWALLGGLPAQAASSVARLPASWHRVALGSMRKDPNTGLVGVRYVNPGASLSSKWKIYVFHDLDTLYLRDASAECFVSALKSVLQPLGEVVSIRAYGNPRTLGYRDGDLERQLENGGILVHRASAAKGAVDDAISEAVNSMVFGIYAGSRVDDMAVCIISDDMGFSLVMRMASSQGVPRIALCGGTTLSSRNQKPRRWKCRAPHYVENRHPVADVTVDFRTVLKIAQRTQQREQATVAQ